MSFRRMGIRLVIAAAATAVFYVGIFALRPLLEAILLRMPENYEYLARRFADRGEYERALEACDREIARYSYNFHALCLRADILRRAGRPEEAIRLLWDLPRRYQRVRTSSVPSRGWDPARLHLLLAETLWEARRWKEALDELELALDWRDPQVDVKCKEFIKQARRTSDESVAPWAYVAVVIENPDVRLYQVPDHMLFKRVRSPAGFYSRLVRIALNREQRMVARLLDSKELLNHPRDLESLLAHRLFVEQFPPPPTWKGPPEPRDMQRRIERLTAGYVTFDEGGEKIGEYYLAKNHWARFFRTVSAPGEAKPWRKTKGLCIVARGTVCDDVWPIVSVRIDGRLIGKRYIRSYFYHTYTLPVELEPGTYSVEVAFENDGFNHYTRRDRNVEIREIRFF